MYIECTIDSTMYISMFCLIRHWKYRQWLTCTRTWPCTSASVEFSGLWCSIGLPKRAKGENIIFSTWSDTCPANSKFGRTHAKYSRTFLKVTQNSSFSPDRQTQIFIFWWTTILLMPYYTHNVAPSLCMRAYARPRYLHFWRRYHSQCWRCLPDRHNVW